MADRSSFTQDEWALIVQSAMLASIAVSAAEPNGLWGMLQEGFANASGLAGARDNESPLVRDVVAALGTSEGRTLAKDGLKTRFDGAKPGEVSARAVSALGDVARLLEAKAGADAPIYKRWLQQTAERVANAAKEGSFLGFGGQRVSDSERATLDQISRALNI